MLPTWLPYLIQPSQQPSEMGTFIPSSVDEETKAQRAASFYPSCSARFHWEDSTGKKSMTVYLSILSPSPWPQQSFSGHHYERHLVLALRSPYRPQMLGHGYAMQEQGGSPLRRLEEQAYVNSRNAQLSARQPRGRRAGRRKQSLGLTTALRHLRNHHLLGVRTLGSFYHNLQHPGFMKLKSCSSHFLSGRLPLNSCCHMWPEPSQSYGSLRTKTKPVWDSIQCCIKYFISIVFCLGDYLVGNLKTHKGKGVRFISLFYSLRRIVTLVKKACSSIDCDTGGWQGLMAALMQSFCLRRQAC